MYTNGTVNYNLPLYAGSDKAVWTDLNSPFTEIDTAIKSAVDGVGTAADDIDALEARMDTAELNISNNTGDISGLDTRLTTAEGAITSQASDIADVRNDVEDMICAYNEASATSTHAYAIGDYFIYNDVLYRATAPIAIGDTIVPDTNCTTTNVTTELLNIDDLSGDVSQLQTDMAAAQQYITESETSGYTMVYADSSTVTNVASAIASVLRYMNTNNINSSDLLTDYILIHAGYIYSFVEYGDNIAVRGFSCSSDNTQFTIRYLSLNTSTNNPNTARVAIFGASYSNASLSDIATSDNATLYRKTSTIHN